MRFLLLSLLVVCVTGQPGQLSHMFDPIDINHNHKLELSEFQDYFDSIDFNVFGHAERIQKGGKVQENEVSDFFKSWVYISPDKQCMHNPYTISPLKGDCKLSMEELKDSREGPDATVPPAYLKASFTFYDTNFNTEAADGFLTCDDLAFFFDFLDSNHDDEVSLEEFQSAVTKAEKLIAGIISGTVQIVGK